MTDQDLIITERLSVKPLTPEDAAFILELVNSAGWLRFIGNRNINNEAEAVMYIQKILANENVTYQVVYLKETAEKIGIITFIKRDYLEHPDIGFAFLPQFSKRGYAFEATQAVLTNLIREQDLKYVYAVTVPQNTESAKLLKKIGLNFEKEIEEGKEIIHVYGASVDKLNH